MRNTKRHNERPNGQREGGLTNTNKTMNDDTYGMETANCDISDISYSLLVLADNIRRARGVTPDIFGAVLRALKAVQDAHEMIGEAATAIVRAEIKAEHERKLRELDEQYLAGKLAWDNYSERVELEDVRYADTIAEPEDWSAHTDDIPY